MMIKSVLSVLLVSSFGHISIAQETPDEQGSLDAPIADAETCDTLYCIERARTQDAEVSNAARLFKGSEHANTFYQPLTAAGTASGLPCEGKGCTLTTPNGSGAYKYRGHHTILNTVLGGTVGAIAGEQAFGDAGAIGFGITGALWGNKQSSDYVPAKFERWEKQIRAREDVLNNFRDMVFDPSAPIPFDAHFLGGRRKKKD
jgi:hypothetical protein